MTMAKAYLIARINKESKKIEGKLRVYSNPPWMNTIYSQCYDTVLYQIETIHNFEETQKRLLEIVNSDFSPFKDLVKEIGIED